MSATTIHLQVAACDPQPRGAQALGVFAALVFRAVAHAFVKGRERRSILRAAHEMRRVARSYEMLQPNLAADLQAAARRCEGLLDARR